jgi:hypothetical protein
MTPRSFASLLPVLVALGCSGGPKAGFADDLTDAGPDAPPVYDPPPAWSGGAPVLIAANQVAISLALDEARVYWQGPGGSVFACPLGGCPSGKPTLLSSLIGPAYNSLQTLGASGGDAVFLSDNGDAITSLTVADPSRASTTYTGSTALLALVNDSSHVYFVEEAGVCSPNTLLACPLTGPCASPETLYANASAYLDQLFVADSEVFFVYEDENGYAIHAVSTHGGEARTVCSLGVDGGGVVDMTVAGGFVYMTSTESPSEIYDCPTAGGTTTTIYVKDLAPYALASDGTNLYWTNYRDQGGSVVTCALGKECTSPFTVASNQDGPFAIAANATSVFWSTSTSIFRADK